MMEMAYILYIPRELDFQKFVLTSYEKITVGRQVLNKSTEKEHLA